MENCKVETPIFLAHLPVFAGMPVAYIVHWENGKPDFRIVDRQKQIECYEKKLCAICGRRMFEFWFIGGSQSMDSGQFTDGPMHLPCAQFSAKVCPFLAGIRHDHSTRPATTECPGAKIVFNEAVPTERPDKMAMRRATAFLAGLYQGKHVVYQVTKWWGKPRWF